MATTIERVRSGPRQPPGHLRPAERVGKPRVPEIALGVVLVAAFALGSVLWQTSRAKKEQIVVPVHDIRRGSVIAERDLRPVDVNRGSGLHVVRWSDRATIEGAVALVDLPAAAPLAEEHVGALPPSDPANRLVGLRLEAGAYPVTDLRPGVRVDVVAAPIDGSVVEAAPSLLAANALVRRVDSAGDDASEALSVTIEVPADIAYRVSAAGSSVRLVQVPG